MKIVKFLRDGENEFPSIMIKAAPRRGDGAPMAILELVGYEFKKKEKKKKEKGKAKK